VLATRRIRRRTSSSLRALSTVACLTLSAAVFAGGPARSAGSLQDEVRGLVSSSKLGSARVGICLIDANSGQVLASYNASDAFTPASNMKLLTSGAAMMVLGSDFAFRTEFVTANDNLIIKGSGDPALGDPMVLRRGDDKLTVDDVLKTLAGAFPKAGVSTIHEVILDDRVFDREFVHPRWNPENLHLSYSAPVAGINFHSNVLSFFPRPNPAGPGASPVYSTQPTAPWLRVDASKARTVAKGSNSVWLARETSSSNDDVSFVMRGDVAVQAKVPADITLLNPPVFFGRVFATNLLAADVMVGGGGQVTMSSPPASVRFALPEERFDTATLPNQRTVAVVSTPIAEVLRRCNVDSENLYAEALFKRMGFEATKEPGSWTNGAAVLRMMLSRELGPQAAATTTVSDGSGLSPDNRVTPNTLARWLEVISKKPWADTYIESLATPGEGTLERRFRGVKLRNQVHAKSGYIKGVRCLSGYVTDSEHQDKLIFAVMVNGLPPAGSEIEHQEARKLHEEIVQLLDRAISRRTVSEPKVGG
jgi:D-alanyl-D-alanine carboxypeptidase/D-alanyl-D-alanine-endopeptidase (penicillin-binding protein 4)